MSTSDSCKDGASKSNCDGICEMNDKLQNMSTADKDILVCANCGKEGANNICNKCKMVKYCNAACKKKHRHNNIRKIVKNMLDLLLNRLPNYTMKSCSNNLHRREIVLSAFYFFLLWIRVGDTRHVAEKLYVADVVMHLSTMTKEMKLITTNKTSVHFVEFWLLTQ